MADTRMATSELIRIDGQGWMEFAVECLLGSRTEHKRCPCRVARISGHAFDGMARQFSADFVVKVGRNRVGA